MTTQRHDVEANGPIEATEPVTDPNYSPQPDRSAGTAPVDTPPRGTDPHSAGAPLVPPASPGADNTAGHDLSATDAGDQRFTGPQRDEPPAESGAGPGPSTVGTATAPGGADTSTAHTDTSASTGLSQQDSLFAGHHLAGLRSRWSDVQAAFVDNPRDCVQRADSLVSDVIEHLTTGFSETRSRLEEQWSRGEPVSTEDLRVALTRYRDLFDRLLAV